MLAVKQPAASGVKGPPAVNHNHLTASTPNSHGHPIATSIQEEGAPTGTGVISSRKSTKSTAQFNIVSRVEDKASAAHLALEIAADVVAHPILFHVISGDQVGEEFLVHADCAVGVMMDFIKRRITEDKVVPDEAILELFDENGESLSLHKSDPLARGTAFVKHRGVYFPMYFVLDNGESESDELVSSEGSSSKMDLASQIGTEWSGESPCEEDDIDEELRNPDGSEIHKNACISSSVSSTSVSSAGSHTTLKSHPHRPSHPSTIPEEEYGEDGHLHHHPQMLHSKYQQEFCGEGHHDDHHHHHHHDHKRVKSVNINPDTTVAASDRENIPHDDEIQHVQRTSHPQDDQGHGHEFDGEGHEGQLGLHQVKTPEKSSQAKGKKEESAQRRSESKESATVSESSGKKISPGSKGGKRKDKFAKVKKSSPVHNVEFLEPLMFPEVEVDNPVAQQLPSNLSTIPPLTGEIVQPEDMIEPSPTEPTIVEPEVQEQSDYKTEDDGTIKITYIPIISDNFEGCVHVCKRVVDLHLEIDHGVQDMETEPVLTESVVVPPVPQESNALIIPASKKPTKVKLKANANSKKPIKETGGENSSSIEGN